MAANTSRRQTTPTRVVEIRGELLRLPTLHNREVCAEGPAGTAKTRGILEYLHLVLKTYPGVRALTARKTNVDLAASAMQTYQRQVLQAYDGVKFFGGSAVQPPHFVYPNGSELLMIGLDRPEKVKSHEYDLAYINEATEIGLADMETVRSRLGRNGKLPFWQLLMDVNPQGPNHWLKKRMDEGRTTRLYTRHEDNPGFYDLARQQWTPLGEQYITDNLGGLTGVRYLRLVLGKWAAADGLVYDEWNPMVHIVPSFTIPRDWPRFMAIDWGYNNPAVVQWWAIDNDGRMYCYRELYQTGLTPVDLAHLSLAEMGYAVKDGSLKPIRADADPLPRYITTDHDKSDREVFERETGLSTTAAYKDISAGIKALKMRLRVAGDDKPRIFYLDDCLIRRDPKLMEKKLPCGSVEEYDGYIWDTRTQQIENKELPVDANNHGMDATRYAVMSQDNGPTEVVYGMNIWE